jgi:hypothetical protein
MITHFSKTVDTTKGELDLEESFDLTTLKARLANKLGAKTVKTEKSAAAAEVKWAKDTTFAYTVDPADYAVACTNYGWKLTITEPGVVAAVKTLGSVKSITDALITADTDNLLTPKKSILGLKPEVNGLIWNSMVETADVKDGFALTDTNDDKKIDRAEDSMANMIVRDFNTLDTFTPANANTKPENTPEEKSNMQLDKWELNAKYPMWEANNLITTYGGGKDYLNILKFAES